MLHGRLPVVRRAFRHCHVRRLLHASRAEVRNCVHVALQIWVPLTEKLSRAVFGGLLVEGRDQLLRDQVIVRWFLNDDDCVCPLHDGVCPVSTCFEAHLEELPMVLVLDVGLVDVQCRVVQGRVPHLPLVLRGHLLLGRKECLAGDQNAVIKGELMLWSSCLSLFCLFFVLLLLATSPVLFLLWPLWHRFL